MSWTELSLFESHDLLRQQFQRRHDRELSTAKAAEIAAFLTQGRLYLEAARAAAPLVSPLLQYYGVNAITRGAILFLDPRARAATLKPSHGLSTPGWQSALDRGLERVADLEVAVDATGTFPEFSRVTHNRTRVPAFRDDHTIEQLNISGTIDLPPSIRLSLREILSRIPHLNELYEEVLNETPNIFAVGLKTFVQSRRVTIEIYGSQQHPPDEAELRRVIPAFAATSCKEHNEAGNRRRGLLFIVPPREESHTVGELPPLRYSRGVTWLVLPFAEHVDLSTTSVLYALSFCLGMLSRYFPQHWLSLLSGAKGDRLYPLLREASSHVADDFAAEIADQLGTA
jgi:YaaC-like protein